MSKLRRRDSKINSIFLMNNLEAVQKQIKLGDADAIIDFNTHSQKFILRKEEQSVLFQKLLCFIQNFLQYGSFYEEIRKKLTKSSQIQTQKPQKQFEQLSFKKLKFGSKVCFEGQVKQNCNKDKKEKQQNGIIRRNNKKISIFIFEEQYSSSSESSFESQNIISLSSIKTLRQIDICHNQMNMKTIVQIFETPSPFLINLSLCLFIRYCLRSKEKITLSKCSWVLVVSTIVAYKFYYDQEIEGIMDYFKEVISVTKKDIIDMERCYLQEINYETIIKNYDYYFILSKLIAQKH